MRSALRLETAGIFRRAGHASFSPRLRPAPPGEAVCPIAHSCTPRRRGMTQFPSLLPSRWRDPTAPKGKFYRIAPGRAQAVVTTASTGAVAAAAAAVAGAAAAVGALRGAWFEEKTHDRPAHRADRTRSPPFGLIATPSLDCALAAAQAARKQGPCSLLVPLRAPQAMPTQVTLYSTPNPPPGDLLVTHGFSPPPHLLSSLLLAPQSTPLLGSPLPRRPSTSSWSQPSSRTEWYAENIRHTSHPKCVIGDGLRLRRVPHSRSSQRKGPKHLCFFLRARRRGPRIAAPCTGSTAASTPSRASTSTRPPGRSPTGKCS